MNQYKKAVEMPVMGERQFLHTRTAGFDLLLLQSVATALIVGLVVWAVGLAAGWLDAWKPALVGGMLGLGGWWMFSLRRWTRLTDGGMDGGKPRPDEYDGEDAGTPRVVRIQIDKVTAEGGYQQYKMYDLPATEEQMGRLAEGLERGLPFTEREWAGAGRPFSSAEFRELRGELIKRELIRLRSEKDPRQGFELTEEGRQVFGEF